MTEDTLTRRQNEILIFISQYIDKEGLPPTRVEISRHFGFRSPNAAESHLRALARKGGDSGAVIEPGKPDESLLLDRVTATDDAERMPPEGEPLTAEQVELLRRWIAEGGRSPQEEKPETDPRDHWAFRPLQRPDYPKGSDTGRNPIDVFIDHRLSQQRLTARPAAEKG